MDYQTKNAAVNWAYVSCGGAAGGSLCICVYGRGRDVISWGDGSANHFYWNCGEQGETSHISCHLQSPVVAAKPSAATQHTSPYNFAFVHPWDPFSEQGSVVQWRVCA